MNIANVVIAAWKAAIVGSLLTKRVCLLGLLATYLGAFVTPACADDNWIVTRMSGAIRPDVTWEQVKSQMLTAFYQSNPDERGVSAQGIDDLRKIAVAQRRSQAIAQILNYDLDGDGSVTKNEITAVMQPRAHQMIHANGIQLQPTPEQIRAQLDKLVTDTLKPDTDHDGVISAAEIQQEGARQAEHTAASWQQNVVQYVPMTLDANGDGFVSLAEYEEAVRKQFDSIDEATTAASPQPRPWLPTSGQTRRSKKRSARVRPRCVSSGLRLRWPDVAFLARRAMPVSY